MRDSAVRSERVASECIALCRTLEESDEVGLSGLLQGQDGGSLEAEIVLEILGDLAHQSLEGQLADEQISGLICEAMSRSVQTEQQSEKKE